MTAAAAPYGPLWVIFNRGLGTANATRFRADRSSAALLALEHRGLSDSSNGQPNVSNRHGLQNQCADRCFSLNMSIVRTKVPDHLLTCFAAVVGGFSHQ